MMNKIEQVNMSMSLDQFYCVYVLLSLKDDRFYIGYTTSLKRRMVEHEEGEVKATKERRPLMLIYYEAHRDKFDALRRERYFKTSKGKTVLKSMFKEFLSKR